METSRNMQMMQHVSCHWDQSSSCYRANIGLHTDIHADIQTHKAIAKSTPNSTSSAWIKNIIHAFQNAHVTVSRSKNVIVQRFVNSLQKPN